MKIAIFGGASPIPGDTTYEQARQLGNLLGCAGHTVMTGGYIGVMEAASRGAFEAGAHVIGSTCEQLETWRNTKANVWVKEEWKHQTLRERMYALIDACDAAVVMPGGVGTLAELMVMWNEEVISRNPPRLMVVVGDGWGKVVRAFLTEQGAFIKPSDQERVRFAADVQAAFLLINQWHKPDSKNLKAGHENEQ